MLGTKGRKKKQNLKEVLRSKGIEACKKRKQHSLVLKSSGITGQAEKNNFPRVSRVVARIFSTHTTMMLH